MRVTRAAEQDAELLTALVRGSGAYRGRYASIVSDYRVTADYVRRHRVFTAVEPGGRVLGFYALVLDPPELDLMFVADAAQGTGVGRLLVEHMLGQAREAGLTGVRVVSHPRPRGSTAAWEPSGWARSLLRRRRLAGNDRNCGSP